MSVQTGLVVDDVARRFGKRWALARVHLTVPNGSVLMLTGANGSGKTTLLRTLATAIRPHHGRCTFNGVDLWEQRSDIRPSIAFLSHQLRLYDDLSARDNLEVWARLGGLTVDVEAILQQVDLPTDRLDPVRTFSAGMRRRLSLGRLLLRRPQLLLLDEPFSAFDPQGQALVCNVVVDAQKRGATTIITTHVPALAAEICDIAAHLDDGQMKWTGSAADRVAGNMT